MDKARPDYPEAVVKATDNIDRLVALEIGRKKSWTLYDVARKVQGAPLTLLGADLIRRTFKKRGEVALIITGTLIRPHVEPSMGETDGPPGAAVLARALTEALGVLPVILTDRTQVAAVEGTLLGGGLRCLPVERARATHADGYGMVCGMVSDFPLAEEEPEDKLPGIAQALLRDLSPRIVVSIERGGFSGKHVYHNSSGKDRSATRSKFDYVALAAEELGIPSIGIGDGGNEIGMGLIREQIKNIIPFGEKCDCPCGAGIISTTSTTVLLVGATSNWAAYGLVGALSLITGNRGILHTAAEERILLEAAVNAGLVDGHEGPRLYYDGMPLAVCQAVVELIRFTAEEAQ
jgi:hypothetical protein